MKIDPNNPAMPADIYFGNDGQQGYEQIGSSTYRTNGLTIRAELAARMEDDFGELEPATQYAINGLPPTREVEDVFGGSNEVFTQYGTESYVKWLAEGRAKWRLIQADALISQLNKTSEDGAPGETP